MNRGQIRSQIIGHLREADEPVRWTADELNRYIDDGYREMAELTGAVVRTDTLTVRANNTYLTLPADCLYTIAAKDVVLELPVDPVNWMFLDQDDGYWIRVRSTRSTLYAPFGLGELIFYPAPRGDRQVAITMATMPDGLILDTDSPALPIEYHGGLVEYGIFRAMLKNADAVRLGRAERHLGYYTEYLDGLGSWTRKRHHNMQLAYSGEPLRSPEYMVSGLP